VIGAHGIWRSNEDMLRVVLALMKDAECVARNQAAPVSLLSPRVGKSRFYLWDNLTSGAGFSKKPIS
jgi:hypothetical protein